MELERVEDINRRLADNFGVDTITGIPIWRVVWSEDQLEKRYGTFDDITPAGIYLRTVTEVREVPKYRQWIHNKYLLERLVVIPAQDAKQLPTQKVSYEPIHIFQDRNENALPPKYAACEFAIQLIYAVQYGDHSVARYVDPDNCQEAEIANRQARIAEIQEALHGDESGLMGATLAPSQAIAGGSAIIVPHTYERSGK